MRAQLLTTFIYEINMDDMITTLLKNSPTSEALFKCNDCDKIITRKFAYLKIKVQSDFSNFNEDIAASMGCITEHQMSCDECRSPMTHCYTKFNNKMFLSLDTTRRIKLNAIPGVVTIEKQKKVVFGILAYLPPVIDTDAVHYVAVIKINENWIVFDDRKTQSHLVSKNKLFHISAILYTGNDDEKISDGENGPQIENNGVSVYSLSQHNKNVVDNIIALTNGCTYYIGKKKVTLTNTCAFDSVAQVKIQNKIFISVIMFQDLTLTDIGWSMRI